MRWLFVLTAGCSWIGTQPHPVIDGVTAGVLGAGGVAVVVGTDGADSHTALVAFVAVPALLLATVYLAAALK